ncbi:MAG: hypothetical protein IT211_08685 [Armatimonadetes bacterium]|nr:hypothetical protein [Armatimonadota bacterium]
MNNIVVFFIGTLLVSRLFSETFSIIPKAIDVVDIIIIPFFLILCIVQRIKENKSTVFRQIGSLIVVFAAISCISTIVNWDRVHLGPVYLFVFGILEGPLLYITLNLLIKDKNDLIIKIFNFYKLIIIIEIITIFSVSMPAFILTQDPDKVSGTFGNNCYQFSVLLTIMGGFCLGEYYLQRKKSLFYLVALLLFLITFILLQYRTALPVFFISFTIGFIILYGRKFIRLSMILMIIGLGLGYGMNYISSSEVDLKYDDLLVLAANPSVVLNYGKVKSYVNTWAMFEEYPYMAVIGSGPGTFVSRANYTFTIELSSSKSKGVGAILQSVFGNQNYYTDVQIDYILPLYGMEALFGSVQINNPNSSILANLAEVGIAGLIAISILYGMLIRHNIRFLQYAKFKKDEILIPLSTSLFVSSAYFVLIFPLDNYMEIARVSLPIWLLFWVVSNKVEIDKNADRNKFFDNINFVYSK